MEQKVPEGEEEVEAEEVGVSHRGDKNGKGTQD